MKHSIAPVALALTLASCASTDRDLEKENAELRRQVEELKAELARALEREKAPSSAAAATFYRQALALEAEGRGAEAVKLYDRAAKYGSGKAALRLAEIYERGMPGVSRDYAQSLMWYNAARQLGENVPVAGTREPLPT